MTSRGNLHAAGEGICVFVLTKGSWSVSRHNTRMMHVSISNRNSSDEISSTEINFKLYCKKFTWKSTQAPITNFSLHTCEGKNERKSLVFKQGFFQGFRFFFFNKCRMTRIIRLVTFSCFLRPYNFLIHLSVT